MKIAVIGSGAWGTALAICLCKNGHEVTLWTRSAEKAEQMKKSGYNPRLKGVKLPPQLNVSDDCSCASGCRLVVIASPSFAIREICRLVAPYVDEDAVMVSVTKGIEEGTLLRMSQIVQEEVHRPVVALTGPSHAEELAVGMPTGCVAASENQKDAELVQDAFMSDYFRVYTNPDIVGAELGGALKNVIALCVGVTDGMGYGDNIKAMLITRGMTEMARLGVSMGANWETFAGLTGIGDLIVTCTSQHSRNRRAGILIGKGRSTADAMAEVGAAVEGYYASKAAWELAKMKGVDMPIINAAYAVLYKNIPTRQVVEILLNRSRKAESEDTGWN
ncbi:MAG: NAD(P)-dependent glycerol-3-phosphate dehydrogenase [Ruminococcaceae bacterium]|nr:NAD(P)-dependent glycerol-3-phosphate dehydrogenase [Oscillospiraceae bacterium]